MSTDSSGSLSIGRIKNSLYTRSAETIWKFRTTQFTQLNTSCELHKISVEKTYRPDDNHRYSLRFDFSPAILRRSKYICRVLLKWFTVENDYTNSETADAKQQTCVWIKQLCTFWAELGIYFLKLKSNSKYMTFCVTLTNMRDIIHVFILKVHHRLYENKTTHVSIILQNYPYVQGRTK